MTPETDNSRALATQVRLAIAELSSRGVVRNGLIRQTTAISNRVGGHRRRVTPVDAALRTYPEIAPRQSVFDSQRGNARGELRLKRGSRQNPVNRNRPAKPERYQRSVV